MAVTFTARAVYDAQHEGLALRWLAGAAGADRPIAPDEVSQRQGSTLESSLVGHLNLIRTNTVQVIGRAELGYLTSLGKNSRSDTIKRIFATAPAFILVADGEDAPRELMRQADAAGIPLLASPRDSEVLIDHLRRYLTALVGRKTTLHGVFMGVMGIGVLLTGVSGIGKSELALELLNRGHHLVADDAPEFVRIGPDMVSGTCPELLRDFLEVRGLGILNIRAMFGDNAIEQSAMLRLSIHLVLLNDAELGMMDRLRPASDTLCVLDVEIPRITLPVAPGRDLAVLVEAAVRNHVLSMSGYDSAEDFTARHAQLMSQDKV